MTLPQEARRAARERKIDEDKRMQAAERERAAVQRKQARVGRREEMVLAESAHQNELAERLEAKLSSAERRKSSLIEERLERMGPRPSSRSEESPLGSPQRRGRSSGSVGDDFDASPPRESHHDSGNGGWGGPPPLRASDELLPAAVEPPPPPPRNAKLLKKRIKRIKQRMRERGAVLAVAAVPQTGGESGDRQVAATVLAAAPEGGALGVAELKAGPTFEALGSAIRKLLRRVHAWFATASGAKGPLDTASFDALVALVHKVLRDKGSRLAHAELVAVTRTMVQVCAARLGSAGGTGEGLPLKSIGAAFAVIEAAVGLSRGAAAGGGSRSGGGAAVLTALCEADYPLQLIDVFVRVIPDVYTASPPSSGFAVDSSREQRAAARVAKLLGQTLFCTFGGVRPENPVRQEQVVDDVVQYCSAVGWFELVTQLMFRVPRTWIESGSCIAEVRGTVHFFFVCTRRMRIWNVWGGPEAPLVQTDVGVVLSDCARGVCWL